MQGHEGSLRFPNVCRIDTVGDGRCRLLSGGRSVGGRLQPEGARPDRTNRDQNGNAILLGKVQSDLTS